MRAIVYKWDEWNEEDLICVRIDLETLETLANNYRIIMKQCLLDEEYDELANAIEEYKMLCKKIEERKEEIRKTKSEMVF